MPYEKWYLQLRIDLEDGTVLNAFASPGVSFLIGNDWETGARLVRAPSGNDGLVTMLDTSDVVGRLSAGIDMLDSGPISIRAQYEATLNRTGRRRFRSSSAGSLRWPPSCRR